MKVEHLSTNTIHHATVDGKHYSVVLAGDDPDAQLREHTTNPAGDTASTRWVWGRPDIVAAIMGVVNGD